MTAGTGQDHISKKRAVYTLPQMTDVIVRRDHEYARSGSTPLTMDLYYPPSAGRRMPAPAVVFVTGYPDAGAQKMLGCKFKEMGSYISWARLVGASGLVAITYENNEPAADAARVLQYLGDNGAQLGIDAKRVALWACSGNAPTALSLLMPRPEGLKCAVLCYGYMPDVDADGSAADASRRFGFANPCAGKSLGDLSRDVPLLVVRAGQDEMPGLNDTIDRFVQQALALNLPITLVNHRDAPHSFDLFCDDATSRHVIAQILQFVRDRLRA